VSEMLIFAAMIILISVFGIAEYFYHQHNLRSIAIRVHVNGTRGKSSVTRLIAAGLRAGGIRTVAKTTGTLPRVIAPDGTEYPVYRRSRPNIIEQIRIVAFAARNQAKALVIECMALQPYLQSLCELRLIRSTHGVITNAREDHLDVMGPSERDVALALLGTTPVGSILFTCEKDYREEFERACRLRGSRLEVVSDEDLAFVTDEDLAAFSYLEHRENVALALNVCASLGVSKRIALEAMKQVRPDPGALSDVSVDFFGRRIHFVNGFAANDPESSGMIWRMALDRHPDAERRIMVINSRIDRPHRSRQIGESLARWQPADRYIMIGSGSYFVTHYATRAGIEARYFTIAEDFETEHIFEEILRYCRKRSLVVGIGNIAGPGLELVTYFHNRSATAA